MTIESLRKKQWTRTGLPVSGQVLLVTYRLHGNVLVNMIPILSMRVVPAAPLRSNSLSCVVWHEKASHPGNMFSKGRETFGQPRLPPLDICSAPRGRQFFSISETARDEERNDCSSALGAAVRLSSQPHCGSSQVPAVENDVQQDCYSTESHDPDDQQLPHGPQIQPSPGCEVPAEQFWNNLGHPLPRHH